MIDRVLGLSDWSFWGLVILTALFALGAIIFVPRTLTCVAAGFVYGMAVVPFALIGSTLGGVVGFALARYLFRARLERAAAKRPRWAALLRAVDDEGWRIVGLFRLGAPIPPTIQDYLFGLTGIAIGPYVLATLVGLLPQTILYVYLGAVGKMTLAGPSRLGGVAVMMVGAAIMIIVILRVTARAKAALAETVPAKEDLAASASVASELTVKRT